jgi:hypothetical protein
MMPPIGTAYSPGVTIPPSGCTSATSSRIDIGAPSGPRQLAPSPSRTSGSELVPCCAVLTHCSTARRCQRCGSPAPHLTRMSPDPSGAGRCSPESTLYVKPVSTRNVQLRPRSVPGRVSWFPTLKLIGRQTGAAEHPGPSAATATAVPPPEASARCRVSRITSTTATHTMPAAQNMAATRGRGRIGSRCQSGGTIFSRRATPASPPGRESAETRSRGLPRGR